MGIFNNKKQQDLDSMRGELQIAQGAIQEEQATQAKLNTVKQGLEVELSIETDKELEKRLGKVQKALDASQKRLEEAKKRADELSTQVQSLQAEKHVEELNDAIQKDVNSYSRQTRLTIAIKELRALADSLERSAQSGTLEAKHTKSFFGIPHGLTSLNIHDEEQAQAKEQLDSAKAKEELSAQEEFQKVRKQILGFVE